MAEKKNRQPVPNNQLSIDQQIQIGYSTIDQYFDGDPLKLQQFIFKEVTPAGSIRPNFDEEKTPALVKNVFTGDLGEVNKGHYLQSLLFLAVRTPRVLPHVRAMEGHVQSSNIYARAVGDLLPYVVERSLVAKGYPEKLPDDQGNAFVFARHFHSYLRKYGQRLEGGKDMIYPDLVHRQGDSLQIFLTPQSIKPNRDETFVSKIKQLRNFIKSDMWRSILQNAHLEGANQELIAVVGQDNLQLALRAQRELFVRLYNQRNNSHIYNINHIPDADLHHLFDTEGIAVTPASYNYTDISRPVTHFFENSPILIKQDGSESIVLPPISTLQHTMHDFWSQNKQAYDRSTRVL